MGGWAAFSSTEMLAKVIAPLLSNPLPRGETQVGTISEFPLTWPTLVSLPCKFPKTSFYQTAGLPKLLSVAFPYEQPVLTYAADLSKSLKGLKNRNMQHLTFACHIPLAEQLLSWC